jgi:predicted nucleotidyltransferase
VDIGGVRVPVISPEDLVVTKILAGRPKDLEDVKGILDERAATLNPATIRDTLALLEDALSMNDLTPVFDLEWRRVSSR